MIRRFLYLAFCLLCVSCFWLGESVAGEPAVSSAGDGEFVEYKVGYHDTYYSIGRKFLVPVANIQKFNGVDPSSPNANRLYVGTVLKIPRAGSGGGVTSGVRSVSAHKRVKRGGNVVDITIKEDLLAANPKHGESGEVGSVVKTLDSGESKLKSGRRYTILRSDTLYSISKRFSISVSDLMAYNNIRSAFAINPGDVIAIPTEEDLENFEFSDLSESSYNGSSKARSSQVESGGTNDDVPLSTGMGRSAGVRRFSAVSGSRRYPCGGVKFVSPVDVAVIVKSYMESKKEIESEGVLIKSTKGGKSVDVLTAAKGSVIYSGSDLPDYGKFVIIQHTSGGWFSIYAYLDDILVKKGDFLKSRDKVGTIRKGDAMLFVIREVKKPLDPEVCLK